ncbi:hypothetical protein Q9966_016057 [Columba livia]|nr:hypothetical protein Q9966_016057 [Columba livia]
MLALLWVMVMATAAAGGDPGGAVQFLVVGDWGGIPEPPFATPREVATAAAMGRAATELGADFVLALGDNFYYKGVRDEWDPRFQDTFERVFSVPGLRDLPWFVLAGNHDHAGNVTAQMAYGRHSPRWHFPHYFYSLRLSLPGTNASARLLLLDTVLLCGGGRRRRGGARGPRGRGGRGGAAAVAAAPAGGGARGPVRAAGRALPALVGRRARPLGLPAAPAAPAAAPPPRHGLPERPRPQPAVPAGGRRGLRGERRGELRGGVAAPRGGAAARRPALLLRRPRGARRVRARAAAPARGHRHLPGEHGPRAVPRDPAAARPLTPGAGPRAASGAGPPEPGEPPQ